MTDRLIFAIERERGGVIFPLSQNFYFFTWNKNRLYWTWKISNCSSNFTNISWYKLIIDFKFANLKPPNWFWEYQPLLILILIHLLYMHKKLRTKLYDVDGCSGYKSTHWNRFVSSSSRERCGHSNDWSTILTNPVQL